MPRGYGLRRGGFSTEIICWAVKKFSGRTFKSKEICDITGIESRVVSQILTNKIKQGEIIRMDKEGLKESEKGFTVRHISKGFIADLVWMIMKSAQKPLTCTEIWRLVQKKTKIQVVRGSVQTVISYWKRNGHIETYGVPLKYKHSLKLH